MLHLDRKVWGIQSALAMIEARPGVLGHSDGGVGLKTADIPHDDELVVSGADSGLQTSSMRETCLLRNVNKDKCADVEGDACYLCPVDVGVWDKEEVVEVDTTFGCG